MHLIAQSDTCYDQAGSVCKWVYEKTGENEDLASLANWFVDRPLRVLFVLIIAWIAARITRRSIARGVPRIVCTRDPAAERITKLGFDMTGPEQRPGHEDRREARTASITTVLTSTATVLIWTVALLTILGIVGIQLGPLLAGAGIAGVALGFGAQGLVKDCIAGLFMLIEDQYGIGDVVDLGEASGVVEEVSLRVTVLRSVDGTVWHVPNGVVQRVGNKSQFWSMAVIDIDVSYSTDLAVARALLRTAADNVCETPEYSDLVLEPPTVLGVERLGADGITLRLTVKVKPGEQWSFQRALREQTKQSFDDAGIEIPFPQRTVWMRADPSIKVEATGAPDIADV